MAARDDFDIDLGSYLRVLVRYWWLILAFAAVGAIAAAGLTFTQSKTYQAQSSVYLGQPTDANGNAIAGLQSNPKAAAQILTSETTLRQAANAMTGETVRRLRRGLTVETPTQMVKGTAAPINFVTISVADSKPARAAGAANALASILVERISGYARRKILFLQDQIRQDDEQLAGLQARVTGAQNALDAIARGAGSASAKALASTPYTAILQSAATQRQPLLDDKRLNALMLQTAKGVEQPRILTGAATPSQATGPTLNLNAAAGLLVGLVVGVVVAFALDRRRRHAADIR
jgi:succinoglycan biosynthesis transport protein ExoP